jgi:hypothetical protein
MTGIWVFTTPSSISHKIKDSAINLTGKIQRKKYAISAIEVSSDNLTSKAAFRSVRRLYESDRQIHPA